MATRIIPENFDTVLDRSQEKRIEHRKLLTYQSWRAAWEKIRFEIERTIIMLPGWSVNHCLAILAAFGFERGRQIEKWGDQTHACVPAELPGIPTSEALMLRSIATEMEHAAKNDCNNAFREGNGTWWHIAWEELAEAGAAPPEKRREELVQLGAVIVAWIEDLDARTAAKDSIR